MNEIIIAAGGVVWRHGADKKVEVALIHRPRYDDWSLPKGKLDSGESLIACAYREIMEETGLTIQIGQFIGEVRYFTAEGEKQVSYWCAKALDSEKIFSANSEVDQLLWLGIESALEKLTQENDVEILTKFLSLEFDTTPLIMLRHAKALARKEWQGGDEDRPLDLLGQQQARRMHSLYQVYGIGEIYTSDAVRCYDTVIGMTKALGVEPKVTNQLSEYTFEKNKEKALDFAKELGERVIELKIPILLCSHNPILPRMLEKLTKKSKVKAPETKLLPGEAWIIYYNEKKPIFIETISAPLT